MGYGTMHFDTHLTWLMPVRPSSWLSLGRLGGASFGFSGRFFSLRSIGFLAFFCMLGRLLDVDPGGEGGGGASVSSEGSSTETTCFGDFGLSSYVLHFSCSCDDGSSCRREFNGWIQNQLDYMHVLLGHMTCNIYNYYDRPLIWYLFGCAVISPCLSWCRCWVNHFI
jgi:hypothetical protein